MVIEIITPCTCISKSKSEHHNKTSLVSMQHIYANFPPPKLKMTHAWRFHWKRPTQPCVEDKIRPSLKGKSREGFTQNGGKKRRGVTGSTETPEKIKIRLDDAYTFFAYMYINTYIFLYIVYACACEIYTYRCFLIKVCERFA